MLIAEQQVKLVYTSTICTIWQFVRPEYIRHDIRQLYDAVVNCNNYYESLVVIEMKTSRFSSDEMGESAILTLRQRSTLETNEKRRNLIQYVLTYAIALIELK